MQRRRTVLISTELLRGQAARRAIQWVLAIVVATMMLGAVQSSALMHEGDSSASSEEMYVPNPVFGPYKGYTNDNSSNPDSRSLLSALHVSVPNSSLIGPYQGAVHGSSSGSVPVVSGDVIQEDVRASPVDERYHGEFRPDVVANPDVGPFK